MDCLSLLAIATALALDAFAVSLATGCFLCQVTKRHIFRFAFHFGLFQALMPVLGWSVGIEIQSFLGMYDHWVALGLLTCVGGKMIYEGLLGKEKVRTSGDPTRGWSLVFLSVATSLDALAVGISLAMLGESILLPAVVIGIVAAAFTTVGMLLGKRIGLFWGKKVVVVGGLILIGIGIKIVIEHLL